MRKACIIQSPSPDGYGEPRSSECKGNARNERTAEMAPGIHRIEAPFGDRIVCLFLLVGDARSLLIDTGLDATPSEVLFPYIVEAGLDPQDIPFALNSHADFDHVA